MEKILIGTENYQLYEVLSSELSGQGFETSWQVSGQESYEAVLALRPDLLMLDIHLPVFNGLETASLLRNDPEVAATLPILLLSEDEVDPHLLEKHGITATFPKTHGVQELLDCVYKHINYSAG